TRCRSRSYRDPARFRGLAGPPFSPSCPFSSSASLPVLPVLTVPHHASIILATLVVGSCAPGGSLVRIGRRPTQHTAADEESARGRPPRRSGGHWPSYILTSRLLMSR